MFEVSQHNSPSDYNFPETSEQISSIFEQKHNMFCFCVYVLTQLGLETEGKIKDILNLEMKQ